MRGAVESPTRFRNSVQGQGAGAGNLAVALKPFGR